MRRIDAEQLISGEIPIISRTDFGSRAVVIVRGDDGRSNDVLICALDREKQFERVSGGIRIFDRSYDDFVDAIVRARPET